MIRVVLADDHDIVRGGLRMLLEADPDIEVVGEAAEGVEAYGVVSRTHPDVILLDISMPPGQSGLATCENISRDFPEVRIIILTMFAEPEYLDYTVRNGAAGYLIKNASPQELTKAVRTVMRGQLYVHPSMVEIMSRYRASQKAGDGGLNQLTAQEIEVVRLLARGYTNKQISDQLYVSVKTVEVYRSRIVNKLNIKSRADIVDFAIQHKLFDL